MEKTILSKAEANKQIKVINRLWEQIEKVLDKEKSYLSNTYFNINLKEEKEHVKGKPQGTSNFLTAKEGARYFSVKWIIEPLQNGTRYTIKDVFKCRQSCLYGESIVANYEKELREALKGIDLNLVLSFDYCDLQNAEG